VSARSADAGGKGTAAGRGSDGPIPTASFYSPAKPDQFSHLSNPAPEMLFLGGCILRFEKNSRKCLSINNLRTKSRFFKSGLIKPNQA
jgi:hypothetical protein